MLTIHSVLSFEPMQARERQLAPKKACQRLCRSMCLGGALELKLVYWMAGWSSKSMKWRPSSLKFGFVLQLALQSRQRDHADPTFGHSLALAASWLTGQLLELSALSP
jgi:hypothetical protein